MLCKQPLCSEEGRETQDAGLADGHPLVSAGQPGEGGIRISSVCRWGY